MLIGLAVLTGQLTIGWLNDLVDAERDRAVGRPDKPIAAGTISAQVVGVATGLAAAACVPLSLACGLAAGAAHLVAVGAGWAYDLGLKSSRLSVLPYVVCFGLLPVFVVLALPGAPGRAVVAADGRRAARRRGPLRQRAARPRRRRGDGHPRPAAPHRGPGQPRTRPRLLLLAATVVLAAAAPVPAPVAAAVPVVAVLVLAVGFRAGRRPGSRAPFRAVLVVAGIAVALLLAAGPGLVR